MGLVSNTVRRVRWDGSNGPSRALGGAPEFEESTAPDERDEAALIDCFYIGGAERSPTEATLEDLVCERIGLVAVTRDSGSVRTRRRTPTDSIDQSVPATEPRQIPLHRLKICPGWPNG